MAVERWMARIVVLAAAVILAGPVDLHPVDASEPVSAAAFPVNAACDLARASEDLAMPHCRDDLEQGCAPCSWDTWQVTADALFLHRRRPAAADLVVSALDETGILNARDFDLGIHAGFDVALTRRLGECFGIEVRYFGIDHWNSLATAPTPPDSLLQVNASPPVFPRAGTGIAATHTSELHNVEINGHYRGNDRWTLLAGFRYVELDEQFTADLIGAAVPFSYRAATRNRLYGGQLGANVVLWDRGEPFTADAFGKAGIFGNAAAQHSSYATDTVSATGDGSPVSLLGELGITGNYRISQRWSATCGYQLLWINRVALATEQVASSNFVFGSGIDAAGDTFYHGAAVGVQYVR